jgi:hypothetical protein
MGMDVMDCSQGTSLHWRLGSMKLLMALAVPWLLSTSPSLSAAVCTSDATALWTLRQFQGKQRGGERERGERERGERERERRERREREERDCT